MSQALVHEVIVKGHIPPLLSPTERQLLEHLREAVQITRDYWNGTGTVSIEVDVSQGKVVSVRKSIESPRERL